MSMRVIAHWTLIGGTPGHVSGIPLGHFRRRIICREATPTTLYIPDTPRTQVWGLPKDTYQGTPGHLSEIPPGHLSQNKCTDGDTPGTLSIGPCTPGHLSRVPHRLAPKENNTLRGGCPFNTDRGTPRKPFAVPLGHLSDTLKYDTFGDTTSLGHLTLESSLGHLMGVLLRIQSVTLRHLSGHP